MTDVVFGGFFSEIYFRCETHGIPYPKGSTCPRCDQEKTMANEVELDVIMNYNDLNAVIDSLIELRTKYGGRSMVDVEIEYEPYEEFGNPRVYLIPEKKDG